MIRATLGVNESKDMEKVYKTVSNISDLEIIKITNNIQTPL